MTLDGFGQARCETGNQLVNYEKTVSAINFSICGNAGVVRTLPNEAEGPDEIGLEVDDGKGDLTTLFPHVSVHSDPPDSVKSGDAVPFEQSD